LEIQHSTIVNNIYNFDSLCSEKNFINKTFIIKYLIITVLITLSIRGFTNQILLYVNTKINVEKYTKNYVVMRYDPNKVFHIYDKKNEFISFNDQLKKIDSIRMKKT